MTKIPRWAGWLAIPLLVFIAAAFMLDRALSFDAPDEFWRQKGELASAGLELLERDSLYDSYQLTLTSSAGYRLRGHLRVPRAEGRWPGLVVIGGLRTGRMAAELITPPEPYVILGLDYPWEGPTELTWWQFLRKLFAVRRAMLLTPSALFLAIDYLETRADVDSSSIVLAGASFGAQLVTVAGALDERAAYVLSIYGGGDYAALLRGNLRLKPMWLRSLIAGAGGWLLDPIEPLHYVGLISPRPFVIINGFRDERIPTYSVAVLYETAREPKQLIWLDEGHISSRDEALLGRVLQAAVAALAADSLPVKTLPK